MKEEKMEPYCIVTEGGIGEIEEKKSKFIAVVRPVDSIEDAMAFIEEMKKKYWDARHHCSAFVIGKNAEITRCSDDGEPGGTAGRPMLEVLLGAKVCNTAVVVIRYFGGTLLGTGGLVRAYTKAAQVALSDSQTALMRYGTLLKIGTDYNGIGKILYILGQFGMTAQDTEYTDSVSAIVMVPKEQLQKLKKEITEATNGRTFLEETESFYYIDKK